MNAATGSRQPATKDPFAEQRQRAKRAYTVGRRWYLRAVLMMVIAVFAAWRGGQLNYTLGVVMVLLAGLSVSLGRSMRRGAAMSLEKIDLMEKTGAPPAR